MPDASYRVPTPVNEPVRSYAPGSSERASLQAELKRQSDAEPVDIPLIIDGEEVRTGNTVEAVIPHDHGHVLAKVHQAGEREVALAIESSLNARAEWSRMEPADRASVFLRAGELLRGPWRDRINAATMLNQSKTCHQAEIDAACELIDFFRFNCMYMERIYSMLQPEVSPSEMWNRTDCRPLEGFVYAITPFNFTSIAANLPHAPALMGGTAIWKPSPSALYSNYMIMQLFDEAGLPPGVINFIPGDAPAITDQLLAQYEFAGLHYTGSTAVFRKLWHSISSNLDKYRDYPRIVGETGGKDFLIAHASCDATALVAAMVRGAFEFQGQKCSALSRCYVPKSLWEGGVKEQLIAETKSIRMGDTTDFSNFIGAVIHRGAFDRCKRYIDAAKSDGSANILAGGTCDDSKGFFVEPTVIETTDPKYASMCEEIFGPILTVHVYEDSQWNAMLKTCSETSPYGLTGAVFANDRRAVVEAMQVLRYSAGNFYINDKPTGAVVGQQPFGGSRASGTNDKAGSMLNLLRWITPRTIKETFDPPRDYRMPFLDA